MNYAELSEIMFPGITGTPEELEAQFPQRDLPEGAVVTRFAPSPTGFLHIGGLFAAMVASRIAKQSGGVFFLRIEDTDKKREIENGVDCILEGLAAFGISPDEGVMSQNSQSGNYGPYLQSRRKDIYQTYAKSLVAAGAAYPCFCTEEELDSIRQQQEAQKLSMGCYGEWAPYRNTSPDEAAELIKSGKPYVVRLRSTGDANKRITFKDAVKGTIEMPQNEQDVVILKVDGIPTYHFAHAVDDHLMRTTHVIRGDEWISSVPLHLELFRVLGFKPPKYAHISPIMKEENGGKRKLSKRKDPEAAVTFYHSEGYPSACVTEYLLTLANSVFEEWRIANPTADQNDYQLKLNKMSISGALFDIVKLNDVSKNYISRMSAKQVYEGVCGWSKQFDPDFYEMVTADEARSTAIFNIDREVPKPRKDIAKWSEVRDYYSYLFYGVDASPENLPDNISMGDAAAILDTYAEVYSADDDKNEWFAAIKAMCPSLGFASEVKQYKKSPEEFKGHCGDVSGVIRVAVTGRRNTPDLHSILSILGRDEVLRRLAAYKEKLEEADGEWTK